MYIGMTEQTIRERVKEHNSDLWYLISMGMSRLFRKKKHDCGHGRKKRIALFNSTKYALNVNLSNYGPRVTGNIATQPT